MSAKYFKNLFYFKVLSLPSNFTYNPPGTKIILEHPPSQIRRQTLHSHQPIMMPHLGDIKNIDESISDIYSTQEHTSHFRDKSGQQNVDEIVTIRVPREPKTEDMVKVKRINETNDQNKRSLLVPHDPKPVNRLFGSTKHLFQKQLSMETVEETTFLLSVPNTRKTEEIKIPLPKHDSQESVQRIITERRKLDENFKEINKYDIYEVSRKQGNGKTVEGDGGNKDNTEGDSQC